MLDEARNQAQRSSYSTESSDRERYEVWVMETEEPLEYEVYLVSKPRKKLYTLISCACVTAVCCRTEGEYHHESRDDEHARDDGKTYLYTASTTVEHSIEHADEHGLLLTILLHCVIFYLVWGNGILKFIIRISFQHEALHQSGGNHTATTSTKQADDRSSIETLTCHKHDDKQTHTECGTEVCQRDKLIFLEIAGEALFVSEGDNGRVVGEECHYCTEGSHAREIEDRTHERTKHALQQCYYSKFHEHSAQCTCDNADTHQIEYCVEQQVVCGFHDSVEHVWHAHHCA